MSVVDGHGAGVSRHRTQVIRRGGSEIKNSKVEEGRGHRGETGLSGYPPSGKR